MILENPLSGKNCRLCQESRLKAGEISQYGAKIILSLGDENSGWFATLSPQTGGEPQQDFSLQLAPNKHLKNFSELNQNHELAVNYGLAFAKLCFAVAVIMKEEGSVEKVPIGTYGKCKHPDEHLHVKIFPWRGNIGQPYTVDSSFGSKEIYIDEQTGKEFVKMQPVRKVPLSSERFNYLSKKLIGLLQ